MGPVDAISMVEEGFIESAPSKGAMRMTKKGIEYHQDSIQPHIDGEDWSGSSDSFAVSL